MRKLESRSIKGMKKKCISSKQAVVPSLREGIVGREGRSGAFFCPEYELRQDIIIKGAKKRLPGSDGQGVADGGISKQDDLASLMPQDLYRKQHTSDRSLNVASLAAHRHLSIAS